MGWCDAVLYSILNLYINSLLVIVQECEAVISLQDGMCRKTFRDQETLLLCPLSVKDIKVNMCSFMRS